MIKLDTISDRAVDLAGYVGDNMKMLVTPSAGTLISAGAKMGAIRAGVRVAGMFVRRNPAVAIATAAGAGLLWYAAARRARQAEQGNDSGAGNSRRSGARNRNALEGSATRVDARASGNGNNAGTGNGNGGNARRAKSGGNATRKRASGASSRSGQRRGADATPSTTH